LGEFEANVPVQDTNEVENTIHYAASLEAKSRFSNWEIKIGCAVLPKIKGMIVLLKLPSFGSVTC
jgi:hypothetical protein